MPKEKNEKSKKDSLTSKGNSMYRSSTKAQIEEEVAQSFFSTNKLSKNGCGKIVLSFLQFLQWILQLQKKKSFFEKVQRVTVIFFLFFMAIVSGSMLGLSGSSYFKSLEIIANATLHNTTADLGSLGIGNLDSTSLLLLNIDNIGVFSVGIVLFLTCLIFEKLESIICFLVTLLTFFYVNANYFIMQNGFFGGCEIAFLQICLIFSLFVTNNNYIKIFWVIIFLVNIIVVLAFDLIYMDYYQKRAISGLEETYLFSLLYGYTAVFLPSILTIFTYFSKQFTTMSFIKKKTKIQESKLEKFNELEDFDIILEEQKIEKKAFGNNGEQPMAKLKVNKSLFLINYEDVKILTKIGSGGSGATIYKAEYFDKIVAFKVFQTKNLYNQFLFDAFEKEIQLFSSIRHPNILQFYGASIRPPRVGILTEFCPNGDLNYYIQKCKAGKTKKLEMGDKLRILTEIASAFTLLVDKNIIHRDLKLSNVLLNDAISAKVMDFGLSRVQNADLSFQNMTKGIGTTLFMAPEITSDKAYNYKVDVFSFGIVIYMLITENLNPYGKQTTGSRIVLSVASDKNYRPKFPQEYIDKDKWLCELAKKCWDHEPRARPNFKEIYDLFKEKRAASKIKTPVMTEDKVIIKEQGEDDKETTKEKLQNELSTLKKKIEEYSTQVSDIEQKLKQLEE